MNPGLTTPSQPCHSEDWPWLDIKHIFTRMFRHYNRLRPLDEKKFEGKCLSLGNVLPPQSLNTGPWESSWEKSTNTNSRPLSTYWLTREASQRPWGKWALPSPKVAMDEALHHSGQLPISARVTKGFKNETYLIEQSSSWWTSRRRLSLLPNASLSRWWYAFNSDMA